MAQTKNINIIPNSAITRVHVSQGDVGRTIYFNLYEGSIAYTPTSGDIITCVGTKPSGLGFTVTCTWSGNVVTCVTTEAMTDESGSIDAELVITSSDESTVLGTSNFRLCVEANPHTSDTTDGTQTTADSLQVQITANTTNIATNTSAIGTLTDLTTDTQTDLVSAINEVDANVDKNTSDLDYVNKIIELHPDLYRGTASVSTGVITISDSTTDRLVTDYIDTDSYDYIKVANGINCYVLYYDSTYTFATNSGAYLRNLIAIDQTYPYMVLLLAYNDGSTFDTIPDAVYLYNSTYVYEQKARLTTISDSLGFKKTLYNHSTSGTRFSSSVRWFINEPIPAYSYVSNITSIGTAGAGILYIELWSKQGSTFTQEQTYSFYVSATSSTLTNELAIDYATTEPIYVSVYGSWGAIVTGSTGNVGSMTILRDVSSTSFDESSLSVMSGYLAALDIEYYSLESHRTYRVGENDNVIETLAEAMLYPNSVVYIEPYTHDCITEWETYYGDGYWDDFASGRGLELYNNVHIIGESGATLTCYYTGDNDYVMSNFSLFNNYAYGTGYTLENLIIKTSKIRYCVHDERGTTVTPYKVRYSRCHFSQDQTDSTWDSSRACIGGGLGVHGDVIVEDCIFETVTSTANMDSLAYHNSSSEDAQSSLVIKNCYCVDDSTLQLASYGTSTAMTKVIVANCSFGSAIEELDWTGGSPNFEYYYINNEIRS